MTLGEEVMSDRAETSVGISSHQAARLLRQR
jgi:hypothetical protein